MPPSWSEAVISDIPKEGKVKLECSSYRPVLDPEIRFISYLCRCVLSGFVIAVLSVSENPKIPK